MRGSSHLLAWEPINVDGKIDDNEDDDEEKEEELGKPNLYLSLNP